ncbi:MAG: hypothetical protein KDD62_13870, partial [Bdellovibrionales bacterium]|nr:hypothetical protein [Bdellovibrionales bacterium]
MEPADQLTEQRTSAQETPALEVPENLRKGFQALEQLGPLLSELSKQALDAIQVTLETSTNSYAQVLEVAFQFLNESKDAALQSIHSYQDIQASLDAARTELGTIAEFSNQHGRGQYSDYMLQRSINESICKLATALTEIAQH